MLHIIQKNIRNSNPYKVYALFIITLFFISLLTTSIHAGTTGIEFKGFYDFIYGAATGYLGRGIAITGGIIGLGYGAVAGKVVIALVGVVLAVFGVLGPVIINTLFASATI